MTYGRAASGRRHGRPLAGVVLAAPAVVLFTSMMVVPLVLLLYLSLTDWNGYSPDPGWVGLDNYRRAFDDPEVGHAAYVTGVIAVVGTAGQNVLGLGFAVLLNGSARVNAFFRAVLFYPHVIAALVIGYLWAAILGPQGAVNTLLSLTGGTEAPFLSDPDWALASVVAVIMWAGLGVNVVLYLAGLQTVPASLVEAARMDGANRWQAFRRVTVPLIAPVITLNVVLVLIQLLRTYDLVRSLTAGGPAGRTQTMAYLVLSSSFDRAALGLGCAQAVLLLVASATFAVLGHRAHARLPAGGARQPGLQDPPGVRRHRAAGPAGEPLSLAVSAPVSYVIARGLRRRHQVLLMFFLAGTFVPGQVLVIPMIYVLKTLGLMGTVHGFVLFETTLTLPVSVFLYVGFIRSIPPELDQAAMIDGAGPVRVLWSVILPLIRPAVATCVVLHTLGVWKDFVNPQIILGPESGLYTVTTGIFTAIGPHNTDFTRLYPNVLLGIAPVLVFFVFMQRFIVSGLTAGATKG